VAGTIVEVRTTQPTADVHALAGWAMARGVELEGLSVARPSLEDVYLDLVGETDLPPVADLAATPDAAPAATPDAGPAATRAASPAVTGADPAPDPRTGDTPDGGARR
jgi:ABC-2 type transport system ATP-binding protein